VSRRAAHDARRRHPARSAGYDAAGVWGRSADFGVATASPWIVEVVREDAERDEIVVPAHG
jgi:hypothetical protein